MAGALDVSDVSVRRDTATLLVRKSKSNQMGRGARVVLGAVEGLALCPVAVIREWVELRPVGPGPFLIHRDGSALSRYQFVSVFRKCLGGGWFFAKGLLDYGIPSGLERPLRRRTGVLATRYFSVLVVGNLTDLGCMYALIFF